MDLGSFISGSKSRCPDKEDRINRILILYYSTDHDGYDPVEHWKPPLLFPFDIFAAACGEFPSSLNDDSHILVTGSPVSVLEEKAGRISEQERIRVAVVQGKVMLGSCFGHQFIARSLFGKEVVRRKEKPERGIQPHPEIGIVESLKLIEILAGDQLPEPKFFSQANRIVTQRFRVGRSAHAGVSEDTS